MIAKVWNLWMLPAKLRSDSLSFPCASHATLGHPQTLSCMKPLKHDPGKVAAGWPGPEGSRSPVGSSRSSRDLDLFQRSCDTAVPVDAIGATCCRRISQTTATTSTTSQLTC